MKNIVQLSIATLIFFFVSTTNINAKVLYTLEFQESNVTATINKETTDKQFEDLKAYFERHDIIVKIENISRNNKNEITGLNITISKEQQQSSYHMNSNTPISNLELGYKDGNVFIDNAHDLSAIFGNANSLSSIFQGLNHHGNSLDSLLSKKQFSFGNSDIQKFLNESSFDFEKIQEQFFGQFFNSDHPSFLKEPQLSNPNSTKKSSKSKLPKYSFFSNKKNNKLIVINGETSDYETLNVLAQKNELVDVDYLKPSTAISIYGTKAKYGAIIATTKPK